MWCLTLLSCVLVSVICPSNVITDITPPATNSNDFVSGSVNGNRTIGIVIGARQSNVGVVLNGSGPITVNTNRDSDGQNAQTTLGSNNGSNNGNNNGNGGGLNNGNGNGVNNVGAVVEPNEEDPENNASASNANSVDSGLVNSAPVSILPAAEIPQPLLANNPVQTPPPPVRPRRYFGLPGGNGNNNGNGDGSNNGNFNGDNNYGFEAGIDGVGDGLVKVGNSFVRNWNRFWDFGGNGGASSNGNNNGNGNGQNNGNHNGNRNSG